MTVKFNINFLKEKNIKVRQKGWLYLKEFSLASRGGKKSFKSVSEMKSYQEDKIISQSLLSLPV